MEVPADAVGLTGRPIGLRCQRKARRQGEKGSGTVGDHRHGVLGLEGYVRLLEGGSSVAAKIDSSRRGCERGRAVVGGDLIYSSQSILETFRFGLGVLAR